MDDRPVRQGDELFCHGVCKRPQPGSFSPGEDESFHFVAYLDGFQPKTRLVNPSVIARASRGVRIAAFARRARCRAAFLTARGVTLTGSPGVAGRVLDRSCSQTLVTRHFTP